MSSSFEYTAGEAIELVFDLDVSVTGMTMHFAVVRAPGDTAVLSTDSSPATATASGTDTQQFTVSVDDEDTEALRGTYIYAAEIEDLFGDREEVARGYLTFNAPIL